MENCALQKWLQCFWTHVWLNTFDSAVRRDECVQWHVPHIQTHTHAHTHTPCHLYRCYSCTAQQDRSHSICKFQIETNKVPRFANQWFEWFIYATAAVTISPIGTTVIWRRFICVVAVIVFHSDRCAQNTNTSPSAIPTGARCALTLIRPTLIHTHTPRTPDIHYIFNVLYMRASSQLVASQRISFHSCVRNHLVRI